jgi:hypothetical protein
MLRRSREEVRTRSTAAHSVTQAFHHAGISQKEHHDMASPALGTNVSISATLDILGNTVTVNSGDLAQLKKNFNFTLTQPVVLGTIDEFIDWLDTNLGTGISSGDVNNLQNYIPIQALKDAYISFLTATITITTLIINTSTSTYAFGATMTFTNPINILGLLQFDGIGVLISHTSATGSPAN